MSSSYAHSPQHRDQLAEALLALDERVVGEKNRLGQEQWKRHVRLGVAGLVFGLLAMGGSFIFMRMAPSPSESTALLLLLNFMGGTMLACVSALALAGPAIAMRANSLLEVHRAQVQARQAELDARAAASRIEGDTARRAVAYALMEMAERDSTIFSRHRLSPQYVQRVVLCARTGDELDPEYAVGIPEPGAERRILAFLEAEHPKVIGCLRSRPLQAVAHAWLLEWGQSLRPASEGRFEGEAEGESEGAPA